MPLESGKQDPKLHAHEVVVFLVFVLFLFAVNHDAFAQTKTLESTQTKCIPGKGQQGPAQPPKCWSGSGADIDAVAEEGKKTDTDNRVEVGLDGKMKICTTSVPLDINCKPTRPGDVTYCDLRTGSFACRTFSKKETAGARMAQQLGALARASLDPALQREISAQSMEAASRQVLESVDAGSGTYNDPYCVLVPCNLNKEGVWGDNGARIVTLPKSEIERIKNDPAFSATMYNWADSMQKTGVPAHVPIAAVGTMRPWYLSSEGLTQTYMTDSGSEVRLYSAPASFIEFSPLSNYATGMDVPAPSGDTFFQPAPAPPAQMPSADPWASFRRIPSFVSSTAQKVRNWWYGI